MSEKDAPTNKTALLTPPEIRETIYTHVTTPMDIEYVGGVQQELREARWRASATETFGDYVRTVREGFEFSPWHHEMLCEALDNWAHRRPGWTRLAIFMPPRHSKTELIGRLLPGYLCGLHAHVSRKIGIIYATHTEKPLAQGVNRAAQENMNLPIHRRVFPDIKLPGADGRDEKYDCNATNWQLLRRNGAVWGVGANYVCRGVGSGVAGYDGHFVIADDLIPRRAEAESPVYRESVWSWWADDLLDRVQPNGCLLLTMTPWHLDDPRGRLLEQIKRNDNADGWKVITLPAIMDRVALDDPDRTVYMPFDDPRKEGEALWPGDGDYAWPVEKLEAKRRGKIKGESGENPYDWEAKFQCRPLSPTSRKIWPQWFRWCRYDGEGEEKGFREVKAAAA